MARHFYRKHPLDQLATTELLAILHGKLVAAGMAREDALEALADRARYLKGADEIIEELGSRVIVGGMGMRDLSNRTNRAG